MGGVKELDEKLRALQSKIAEEERDWCEEQRKLFEFEDKFLRDTVVEGNMVFGWGESKSAPIRFRNAVVRKKKRERQQEAAAAASSTTGAPATPTIALSEEDQLKVDLHRFASYSSVTSPAESLRLTLQKRKEQLAHKQQQAQAQMQQKKVKKVKK